MLFKRKKGIDPMKVDTVIGEGTHIEGKIVSQASMHVHGETEGTIEGVGQIYVGEKGIVHSEVMAQDAFVAGKVDGNVKTKGKLTIHSTGTLSGDTISQSFSIEEGGIFLGTSQMGGREDGAERSSQTSTQEAGKSKTSEK
ncbi:bactofilin family protein [Caldalkalibacillus salinus]|uniref:bactofilin family protein n=1 Tax=Caldalkalibacillus salinus TaxID=2803787 RepID=UPI00192226BB|nr:polymer-forming cytoskeletal protein [Caldalkalibacillus salinus]